MSHGRLSLGSAGLEAVMTLERRARLPNRKDSSSSGKALTFLTGAFQTMPSTSPHQYAWV